jgi:hypothetical protein
MMSWKLAAIEVACRPAQGVMASKITRRRDECEGKGVGAVHETRTGDVRGFVAEEPEHYDDCNRLMRPGQNLPWPKMHTSSRFGPSNLAVSCVRS